jgi:chemotaxis protein CheD
MSKPLTAGSETVPIAGIGVCKGAGKLRTLLGSCIGVALYERRLRLLGMAHVVMPDSRGREIDLGKYADTAIPETIRQMQSYAKLERMVLSAKLAGGSNMFERISTNSSVSIGDQNLKAIEELLTSLNIPVVGRHVGGTSGRWMTVDVTTGIAQIQVVGQPLEVI